MSQILKAGQTVIAKPSGMNCEVELFLGGGGQGEVYRADLGGQSVALKWYFPTSASKDQREALEGLIKKGAPNDRFLWPFEMATSRSVPGFGYLMPLREPRYKGIVDLMKRRVEPSFRALTTASVELSHSFRELHSKGLCYRDISFGNVFFDPAIGNIQICDNDNVAVNGSDKGGVVGTPRFMAPEIVRGESAASTQTDLFSLSVLLFYLLVVHHPLEGSNESSIRCLDLPAMTKLYGTDPIFIFDPNNQSNAPVRGLHDNAIETWPIFPAFIRELFTKAFTKGLHDPVHGRVLEGEWRSAMVKLRDLIVYCRHCAGENFVDPDKHLAEAAQKPSCWSCHQDVTLPAHLRAGSQLVMLNHDTQLYSHHIDADKAWEFSDPVAAVTQHPTNPKVWGLKNLGSAKWVSTSPDGAVRDVEPGRSVSLASGAQINFGKMVWEIRA